MRIVRVFLPALLVSLLCSLSYAAADRITGVIDSGNMVQLKNHVYPMARPEFDRGPVDASQTMHVTMLFVPSAQQDRDLQKLLAKQQDSASPYYRRWLTPEQFGERFGLSQGDLGKIRAWLESRGFKVTYVARGRRFLSFEGDALQVESAFRTSIHRFEVNGKLHFANATAPMIPAALRGIVGGFRGLHDFFPHPMIRQHPGYTITISSSNFHFLAPGDVATIYDINPLYSASTPIDGTGQKVVIAGQSDVYLADLHNYRTAFGISDITGCTMSTTVSGAIAAGPCSSGNFDMKVPSTSTDPGIVPGDLSESDLDIELLSSVARGAEIIFVTSANGVDDSASYAIDNNLAPVISYSYGLCEAFDVAPNIANAEAVYQQAATQGISFFAASGDAGSAECDGDNGTYPAQLGPSVSYPASSTYVTGVGGTEFNEGSGSYWGSSNGTDGGSATSYIPEIAWNDTTIAGNFDATGGGASNCVNASGTTQVMGSQGTFSFSICDASNGGFPKPSWQSAATPADSFRDVPDISFSASNANDAYIVCTAQSEVVSGGSQASTCAPGGTTGINNALSNFNPPSAFGGTSAATPIAAGMAVLLNQYMGNTGTTGLGNLNSQIYGVYASNKSVFHITASGSNSVTQGTSDNIEPCTPGQPNFEPTALQCPSNSQFGFTVSGNGYSQVTGLGSIDFNAFFPAFKAAATSAGFTLAPQQGSYQVTQGQSLNVQVNLTAKNGFNSAVTYTCTDPASESTCIGPTGATTQNPVSFAITTTAATSKMLRPFDRGQGIMYAVLLPGLLGIAFTVGSGKRSWRSLRLLGLMMVLGVSTLWLGSCGGNSTNAVKNQGTPKQTYTFTVTGTSGGASNTTTFKVTVQ